MSASRWRSHARRVIASVEAEHVGDEASLIRAISDAYPFGSRTHHPYKIWLSETKRAAAIRAIRAANPDAFPARKDPARDDT